MDFLLEGKVGPRTATDSNTNPLRLDTSSGLVVSQGRGLHYEAASRKRVFSISTAAAGTTVVAANVNPVAAAAATILTAYNPIGSGVNSSLIRTIIGVISGTPSAGPFVYNVASNQSISAAQNATAVCNYIGGGSAQTKGYTQTALTGGVGAQVYLRPLAFHQFAGALAATTPGIFAEEDVAGAIVLPPGGLVSLAAFAAGTSVVVYAAFEFQEEPIA